MLRLLSCLLLLFVMAACSKNNAANESQFYGLWSKGNQAGDTLQFIRKNNKNILRYNMSFNPVLPGYAEVEYRFINGKLQVEFAGPGSGLRELESFAWKRDGEAFEILGYQLYLFMSSSTTKFSFTRIR